MLYNISRKCNSIALPACYYPKQTPHDKKFILEDGRESTQTILLVFGGDVDSEFRLGLHSHNSHSLWARLSRR